MSPRGRIQRFLYSWVPEYDPSSESSLVSSLVDQIRNLDRNVQELQVAVGALRRREHVLTVLLFPARSELEFSMPPLLQSTMRVTLDETASRSAFSSPTEWSLPFENLYWPIPAGSWLVAVGCRFFRVYVGNQSQDTGPDGLVLQLRDRVELGMQLRAIVKGP